MLRMYNKTKRSFIKGLFDRGVNFIEDYYMKNNTIPIQFSNTVELEDELHNFIIEGKQMYPFGL